MVGSVNTAVTPPVSREMLEGERGVLVGVARWPSDRPVAVLFSGDGAESWPTILASPVATVQFWIGDGDRVERRIVVHEGGGIPPPVHDDADAPMLEQLRVMFRADARLSQPETAFAGGWLGWLAYELGRLVEPMGRDAGRAPMPVGVPLAEWHWCPDAIVGREGGGRRIIGDQGRALSWMKGGGDARGFAARVTGGSMDERTYRDGVARIVELIRAGDVFQVNLAHRLDAAFAGSARSAFAALVAAARPRCGAYFEGPGLGADGRHAVLSASPELFLRFDARTRALTTQPMKGTRAASESRDALAHAEKDRAELSMIVDLMRNDLGRVCDLGSVRVLSTRDIESHGHGHARLWQATATVGGRLREDRTIADALWAAFPPGSITGAPKVRAMQIIDEIEMADRGPYCGCAGFVSRCGSAAFNVMIRTGVILGHGDASALDAFADGRLVYGVGAGIVSDSDPAAEWRETLDKARILDALTGDLAREGAR